MIQNTGKIYEPLVSVVINNYNYGSYISQAIESALAQSYKNIEVIVVDDGSTDHSREVIERYIPNGVKAIFQPNCGQAAAMNVGFAQARGELLVILDSDDYLLPSAVERIKSIRKPETVAIYYRLRMEAVDGSTVGFEPPLSEPMQYGPSDQIISHYASYAKLPVGKVFVRSVLEKILPIPEQEFRTAADLYLQYGMMFFGEVEGMDDALAVWRQHDYNDHMRWRMACNYEQLKIVYDFNKLRQRTIESCAKRTNQVVPSDLIYHHPDQVRPALLIRKLYPQSELGRQQRFFPLAVTFLKGTWVYSQLTFVMRLKQTLWLFCIWSIPASLLPGLLVKFTSLKWAVPISNRNVSTAECNPS